MLGFQPGGTPLDTIAHVIQVALTPVFLLSGIATLLNVFATRLTRVADQVDAAAVAVLSADAEQAKQLSVKLVRLHRRSIVLDFAVVLGAIGGASTCAAVFALFLSEVREATMATLMFLLFGLAVICALGAIAAYTIEMMLAGMAIRDEVAESRRAVANTPPVETS